MKGRARYSIWLVIAILVLGTVCTTAVGRTIYVDDDGPADFNNIQAAIDDANDGDVIEVQPGRYTGDANRDIDFLGKAITVRSIDPNDPNVVATTVIDGEGDYYLCLEGAYWLCEQHRGFTFHRGEGPNSVVAGFTITNFCAPDVQFDTFPMPAGGGILCEGSSPTISHCTIIDNWAHRNGEGIGGGGIHCEGGSPIITHCTISKNDAYIGGGGIDCWGGSPIISHCTITNNESGWSGGGLSCGVTAIVTNCIISNNRGGYAGGIEGSPTVSNCTITGNLAIFQGGGIGGSPIVDHCTISNNRAEYGGHGGGIYCKSSNSVVSNCTITGNSVKSGYQFEEWVDGKGGGIYCYSGNPLISQCTIVGNWAEVSGGGIYGSPTVTNSILWANTAQDDPQIYGSGSVSYSDVQGGYPGTGNIDSDPCFADPNNGDYHLKSQGGRWTSASSVEPDANEGRWTKDDMTSPCIDAGDMASPIGYEPFPNGGIINMGAYGGTAEASKSYFGEPVCETIVAGDINGDCKVNFEDFRLMALHWLEER